MWGPDSSRRLLTAASARPLPLQELVGKFIPEAIGKEIEKACQGIYPLQVGAARAAAGGRPLLVDTGACCSAGRLLQRRQGVLSSLASRPAPPPRPLVAVPPTRRTPLCAR